LISPAEDCLLLRLVERHQCRICINLRLDQGTALAALIAMAGSLAHHWVVDARGYAMKQLRSLAITTASATGLKALALAVTAHAGTLSGMGGNRSASRLPNATVMCPPSGR
jgi:tRNA A22 N-methylase